MTFYWLRVIINDMKKNLSQEFEIRDLGKVNCCLRIQFIRNGSKIIMYQKGIH